MKYLKLLENFSLNEDEQWNQAKFEIETATEMFNGLQEQYCPPKRDENDAYGDIVRDALQQMQHDGLVDYDTDVDHDQDNGNAIGSYDYFWFTDKGREEIKSPQDIIDNYFELGGGDSYANAEKSYFNGSEGNGGG